MPAAHGSQSTLALIALVSRRGAEDVIALAALARGEEIEEGRSKALLRAGLLRAGSPPRLPARLIAPVLALEASLGLAGQDLLARLVGLLKEADSPRAREALLAALVEELEEYLSHLADDAPDGAAPDLRETLDDLAATVAQLSAAAADPAYVTRVAGLCAHLVERLAQQLACPRPRQEKKQRVQFSLEELAASVAGFWWAPPSLLPIPAPEALAAALAGPAVPVLASERKLTLAGAEDREGRRARVAAALDQPHPVESLYAGLDLSEALARHVCLVGLGRSVLDEAGRELSAELRPGPAPLSWSTELAAAEAAELEVAAA